MPTYDFEVFLSRSVRYTVVFTTTRGKVGGFVVRLSAEVDGVWQEVRRYDTAHGVPHIDVLNKRQVTVEKLWLPQFNEDDALIFAIEDIKTNYRTFISRYGHEN